MRLMKTKETGNGHTSPCSKAELIAAIKEVLESQHHNYPPLERCTRAHLIDIAAELDILLDVEERSSLFKILKAANIDFDSSDPTYKLVQLAVEEAIKKYGIADLEALGKNLKKSPFRTYGYHGKGGT